MRRGEPQPFQARKLGDGIEQLIESPISHPIGVDVLAKQPQLARPVGDEAGGLPQDILGFAAYLAAPRFRHDAERTEVIAPFRDGNGADTPIEVVCLEPLLGDKVLNSPRSARLPLRQDHPLAFPDPLEHFGQSEVVVWPEHHVHGLLPFQDVHSFLLGHAPANPNDEFRVALLEIAEPAKETVNLVFRPFPDRTGVHQDKRGFLWLAGFLKALLGEHAGHSQAVVLVHLAPERVDIGFVDHLLSYREVSINSFAWYSQNHKMILAILQMPAQWDEG